MRKIAIGAALMGCFVTVPAAAIEVSESLVSKYIETKLPPSIAGVRLMAPKVTLLEGNATFCAIARPKLMPKDVEFCTNLTPKWRQETSSLLGSNMTLTSLNAPGVADKHLEITKKLMNQSVLPALEGIEIYKNDSFIGKRISAIKVKPGKLDLTF